MTDAAHVDEVAPRRGRLPDRPPWLVVWAALALAVAALVTAVVMYTTRPPSDEELRESALLAARTYTTALTTYDHRTLDEDIARVERFATGDFAEEYRNTIESIREQVVSTQAVAVGSAVAAGIEQLEGDEATVLVAVDQQITTADSQTPRSETNRVRMTLVRQDGTWQVSGLQRL